MDMYEKFLALTLEYAIAVRRHWHYFDGPLAGRSTWRFRDWLLAAGRWDEFREPIERNDAVDPDEVFDRR